MRNYYFHYDGYRLGDEPDGRSQAAVKRKRLFLPGILFLLVLGSCSKTFTVHFVNPCDVSLQIATYASPPDQVDSRHLIFEGEVDAMTTLKVEDAFREDPGHDSTLEIRDTSTLVPVNADLLDNQDTEEPIVVIPARACP